MEGGRLVQEFSGAKTDGTNNHLVSYIDPAPDKSGYHWQVMRPGEPAVLIQLDYTRRK